MSLRSPQAVTITGAAQTATAVTASDTFPPSERGFWEFTNGSGGSITATVVVPGTSYGQARADVAVVVGAGVTKKIGPLVPDLADPTTGLITITHSGTDVAAVGAYIYI